MSHPSVRQGWPVWLTALSVAGSVVAVVAVVGLVLWLTVLPAALANLTSRTEDGDRRIDLGTATLTVPADWVEQHPPLDADAVRLLSPDGGLDVTLTITDESRDTAFATLAPAGTAAITEALADGISAVHGRPTADTLVAALGGDGGASVTVVARATGGDIEPYSYAIAQLLAGVDP